MDERKYRPEIDGLRAVAVLSVIFYHLDLHCPGGFCGVDVFFVISGYLITRIFLTEIWHGRFSFVEFWSRRFRRLFPALFVVIFGVLAVASLIFLPGDLVDLGKATLAQSLFLSNVYSWRTTDYFGKSAVLKPFLHMWSLSVEEQFYLAFPIFFVIVSRRRSKLLAVRWMIALSVASLGFSEWLTHFKPVAAFYLLPCRMWELLAGALLAHSPANSFARAARLGGWLGVTMLCVSFWGFSQATTFPGFTALLPCLATVLVLTGARPGSLLFRILAHPNLVFIGKLSYSLYLWHWPVIVFLQYLLAGYLPIWLRLFCLIPMAGLSYLSWRFVEQPCRQAPQFVGRPGLLAGLVLSGLAFLLGVLVVCSRGLPTRFPANVLFLANAENDRAMPPDSTTDQIKRQQVLHLGAPGEGSDFAVWGDSHAKAVLSGLDQAAQRAGLSGVALTRSATPPVLNYFDPSRKQRCHEVLNYNQAAYDYLQKCKPKTVFLACAWSTYKAPGLPNGLLCTAGGLTKAGVKVYVLLAVARSQSEVPRSLALDEYFGRRHHPWAATISQCDEQNKPIVDLLSTHPNIHLLDPRPVLFDSGGSLVVLHEGRPTFCDDGHLSSSGSRWLCEQLVSQLETDDW